jgi:hypothetical protein
MNSESLDLDINMFKNDINDMLTYMLSKVNSDNDSIYGKRYVGKVISYDENKTTKLKIKVFGVYDDVPDSAIPFAFPLDGANSGDKYILPELNSLVNVYFEDNDIYRPMYTTKVNVSGSIYNQGGTTNAKLQQTNNVGDVLVLFENAENVVEFDRKNGSFTYKHKNGMFINFSNNEARTSADKDGNEADIVNSLNIGVGGSNSEYSLSIYDKGIKISDGINSTTSYITINDGEIVVTTDDKTIIGSENNQEIFDETTGIRYSSPGTAVPDPVGIGPYCAIPVCPVSGAPHCGNIFSSSGKPKSSATKNKNKNLKSPDF